VVHTELKAADYPLGIEFGRGRHVARIPLDGPLLRFSPAALAYESRAVEPGLRPVRVDRPQGLRAHLKRIIDWELVTPVEEIAPINWRNLAKRTLRRLR
jgi:hypothetical protein